MVVRGLKILFPLVISIVFLFFGTSLMHNFSRLYELAFLQTHYNYDLLFDSDCYKELSFNHKIICKSKYLTKDVLDFLHDVDGSSFKKVLWDHRGKLTEEAKFGNHHFIVKSAEKKGFLRNLLCMGMGVNVWNNANWALKRDIPVLKPVAMIEKRKWNFTKTYIVYEYEGRVCEKELNVRPEFFPKVEGMKKLLQEKNVIHHDFRLRNMVVLDDGSLQFIDIDKFHHYPNKSLVFKARLKREVYKFNLNMDEDLHSDMRLKI